MRFPCCDSVLPDDRKDLAESPAKSQREIALRRPKGYFALLRMTRDVLDNFDIIAKNYHFIAKNLSLRWKKIIIGMKKFCHAYDNSVCKVPNSSFVKGKLQFGWGKTESDEGARSPVLCRARAKKTFLLQHDR